MIFYFRYEKARLDRRRIAEATKGIGKPKVGGTFELVDQEGVKFTDGDMKGGYSLVSAIWERGALVYAEEEPEEPSNLPLWFSEEG